MKDLIKQFEALTEREKMDFVKAIMPNMCNLFQEGQQEMMSMCDDMMKNCNMDMSKMMGMMNDGANTFWKPSKMRTAECCGGDCSCDDSSENVDLFNKVLNIDFLYLDLSICERCIATGDTLDEALSILSPVFKALKYSVKVNKINVTTEELALQHCFVSSPTIRANGMDICAELVENECEDCGDLCGDSVDCRLFVYDGKEYSQPPTAAIVDGILRVLYGQIQDNQQTYELPENLKKYFIGRESMTKMYIYEPALCCETGVCGVSVDPELLRISSVVKNLGKNGVALQRYNLNNNPQEFVDNAVINELISGADGVNALPATVVDGKIVKTKAYPTNGEIVMWLNIPADYLIEKANEPGGGCCDSSSGCCDGSEGCCDGSEGCC